MTFLALLLGKSLPSTFRAIDRLPDRWHAATDDFAIGRDASRLSVQNLHLAIRRSMQDLHWALEGEFCR